MKKKKINLHTIGYSKVEQARLAGLVNLWRIRNESNGAPVQNMDAVIERAARGICESIAAQWGLLDTWNKSQKWDGFQAAWDAWLMCFKVWLFKHRPALKHATGSSSARRIQEAIFLARIEGGEGMSPEFLKHFAQEIFFAAFDGDVAFFQKWLQTMRRPRRAWKNPSIMIVAWMPAALWAATFSAGEKFLATKSKSARFDCEKPGETLKKTAKNIGLGKSHLRKPLIRGFDRDGQPIFKRSGTKAPKGG